MSFISMLVVAGLTHFFWSSVSISMVVLDSSFRDSDILLFCLSDLLVVLGACANIGTLLLGLSCFVTSLSFASFCCLPLSWSWASSPCVICCQWCLLLLLLVYRCLCHGLFLIGSLHSNCIFYMYSTLCFTTYCCIIHDGCSSSSQEQVLHHNNL